MYYITIQDNDSGINTVLPLNSNILSSIELEGFNPSQCSVIDCDFSDTSLSVSQWLEVAIMLEGNYDAQALQVFVDEIALYFHEYTNLQNKFDESFIACTEDPQEFSVDIFIDKYCIHSDVIPFLDKGQILRYTEVNEFNILYNQGWYYIFHKTV